MKMKHSGKLLLCLLSGLASCAWAADATTTPDSAHNRYQGIVDRNVFGLKTPPPPPPPTKPEDNKPLPKINLTGIITGFTGSKRALLKVQTPARPGAPANEATPILTEGQREGDIEVLEINEAEGTVRVNEAGSITLLTLEKPPNSPAPAPVAAGGVPPPAGFAPPAPNPAVPNNPFNGGLKTIPTRTLRVPPGSGANVGGYGTPGGTAATPQGGIALNFGGSNPQVQQNATTQPNMSLEEAELITEAYHEQLKQKGDPMAALVPPTRLNPTRNTTSDPATAEGTDANLPVQPPTQQQFRRR